MDEVQRFVPLNTDDQTVASRQETTIGYKSIFKQFVIRFCAAVTIGVFLLVAVEVLSYMRYRRTPHDALKPGVEVDLAEDGDAALREYRREFNQSNKVTYHQYVLWRRAPYEGQMISINQDGVRRTVHTQCDDHTLAIWMFGDSVMWGSGTPDEETIPSLVAQDYEKAGHPACIVNYGEKGWSNSQELIELIEQLKHAAKKPDFVLFYDGGTEAFTAYQNGQPDVHSNFNLFENILDNWGSTQVAGFSYLRQTNTYRLLERISEKASQGSQKATKIDAATLSAEVIENYLQNMDIVQQLAKRYGFHPIFFWYPNMAVGHKQLTPFEQHLLQSEFRKFPNVGQMYQAVYERAHQISQPDFYNLQNAVDDQKTTLYRGISHMGLEGNQIVARKLFEILQHADSTAAKEPSN